MIAIALVYGEVEAKHYQDEIASNPMIDSLREKMIISENPKFLVTTWIQVKDQLPTVSL